MPSLTPCAALPFPTDADPIDVAGDIARLALAADTAICRVNGLPLGAIIPWWDMGGAVPEGTLRCDGLGFDGAAFPELAAYLAATNTPDLRGQFLRGTDAAGGAFPGRGQRGGFADAQLANHTHLIPEHGHGAQTLGGGGVDHLHGSGSLYTGGMGYELVTRQGGPVPGFWSGTNGTLGPLDEWLDINPGSLSLTYAGMAQSYIGDHSHGIGGATGAADRALAHNHGVQVFNQAAFNTIASGTVATNRNLPPFANVTFLIQALPNL